LRRLEWRILRRLDGMMQGDYRSLFYGAGLDFADLREYQVGDDIRSMDWNVTARLNEPYVRQYVEDREITAWFLLDLSASMAFGTVARRKESVMTDLVATLAQLLTRNGNRIGGIFYGDQFKLIIPPRGGRNQVLLLIDKMLRWQTSAPGTLTDLTPLVENALNTIRKRSLIFLISDFICLPGWVNPVKLLNRRHDLLPVRLWDPREVELPNVGVVLIEDSETGEQMLVDTADEKFRRRFFEAARRRETNLSQTFRQAGVGMLSLSTDEDLVRAILRFANLRKRMGRY
jgi:uncharacterized protein (DUF58 family)